MAKSFRDKLKTDLIFLDGAFGTYVHSLGLSDKDFGAHPGCMEHLVLSKPDLIAKVHADYLEAGADAVETDTFGASALKLSEYGLAASVYEINKAAAALARKEADRFSTTLHPRYVIGTMGPTGKLPSSSDPALGNITYDELKKTFYEQALGIIDGGADALLVETGQDLLEMKAAANGAKEAIREKGRDLVLMAQCTLANNGRMLLGTEISAVMAALVGVGAEVIGLNCSMGPAEMEGAVKFLSESCPVYISCVPNAGLPENDGGKVVYPLGPAEMADIMARFARQYHIDVMGGCCGTTPEHISMMKKAVISTRKRTAPKYVFFASAYRGFDAGMMRRPIKVGERINTQGSRKMKEMLLAGDVDGIIELGKSQQRAGADILDVCAVLTERQTEKKDAVTLVSRLAESVSVPLMIDSTDPDVIEAALKKYPGTAFINSANLEDGGAKARRIFELAKEHGSFVVNLVIDEGGMARTVERKMEVAGRLIDIACGECRLPRERLVFDLLTFTLATGEKEFADAAVSTIEAIKQLKKKYFGVMTVLGVSNISFGMSKEARRAVNASFLHHAVKAGLDLAIVNPSDLPAYPELSHEERKLADDLVLNQKEDALSLLVDHFAAKAPAKPSQEAGAAPEDVRGLPIDQRIKRCIFDRDRTAIIPLIDEAIKGMDAQKVINEILMEAMKDVGARLDSGEMVLPYVLQAAEVVRKAIEHIEKFLPKEEGVRKGTILLATVQGDVHDIGKNLVKMILENNGFAVLDLGKQVPVETVIEEAEKHHVDAVGLSALLVSTAKHMKTCVRSMHAAGLDYPVIIGGAPINDDFASEISLMDDGDVYKGGVFYARDAFTGLRITQALMEKGGRIERMDSYRSKVEEYRSKKGGAEFVPAGKPADEKPALKPRPVPEPPFYGPRAVPNIPADEVFAFLDEKALFERSWSAKLKDAAKKEGLIENEFRPMLKELKEEMLHKGWLDLKAVYGYFKCRVSGTDMKVVDKGGTVLAKFAFGHPSGERPRELTDYFLSGAGVEDLVIFQAVTVGGRIGAAIAKLNEENEITKAFYLHGLAVNLAEALAEYVHRRIRNELGLKEDQGRRYSPGYPLWKDLSDQAKVFKLLDVENKIGVKLTEDHQMVPEASTTAMVVYNEKAEY